MADDYSTKPASDEFIIHGTIARRLPRFCHQFLCAEDIAQDVQLRLLNYADKYDPEKGERGAWVFKSTINAIISHIQKCKQRLAHISLNTGTGRDDDETSDVLDLPDSSSASDLLEVYDLLEKIFNQLQPQEVELALMMFRNSPYTEIAERLQISKTYVGVKINRLRKKIDHLKESLTTIPKPLPTWASNT